MSNVVLEPIDLYGNWKVTQLRDRPPRRPFGLKKGKSKFKIRHKGSRHVLIKKRSVGWNGKKTEILLTEVTSDQVAPFAAGLRLKARVTFRKRKYDVSFGSNDNGEHLQIEVVEVGGGPITGGSGTAGRGG